MELSTSQDAGVRPPSVWLFVTGSLLFLPFIGYFVFMAWLVSLSDGDWMGLWGVRSSVFFCVVTGIPCLLAGIGVWRADTTAQRAVAGILVVCYGIGLLSGILHLATSARHNRYESGQALYLQNLESWRLEGRCLNPLILRYLNERQPSFRFPQNDDEAEIDGLVPYLAANVSPEAAKKYFRDGKIVDPWGDQVAVVMDHDRDMVFKARSTYYGIWSPTGNRDAVGLLMTEQKKMRAYLNEHWSLEEGIITNPKP